MIINKDYENLIFMNDDASVFWLSEKDFDTKESAFIHLCLLLTDMEIDIEMWPSPTDFEVHFGEWDKTKDGEEFASFIDKKDGNEWWQIPLKL